MTPEERDLLSRYLDDLRRAQPGPKDEEAAGRIAEVLRAPDAGYVLVQHAILADAALQDAQARIAELERRLEESGRGADAGGGEAGGFLGSLFGRGRPGAPRPDDSARFGGGSAVPATGGPFGGGYGGGYGASYPQAGPGAGPFSGGGGLGSFLRGAGQTAAGVAGGAFLFEGLQGLFGGGRHEGLGGFGGLGGGGQGFLGGDGGGNFDVGGGGDAFSDGGGRGSDDAGVDYGAMDGDPGSDDYS